MTERVQDYNEVVIWQTCLRDKVNILEFSEKLRFVREKLIMSQENLARDDGFPEHRVSMGKMIFM